MLKVPLWMLPHKIQYEAYQGMNEDGCPTYVPPISITHVRVDFSDGIRRSGMGTADDITGVIFAYAEHTEPFPAFVKDSQVVFDGQAFTLKRVIPCYLPNGGEVWSYELEVV